jgi:hypothetical protein
LQIPSKTLTLAFVVILSLMALAFTMLAPGFRFDNGLVYGGF